METGIYVIFPDRKVMDVNEIMSLAKEALNDGTVVVRAENVEDAIYLLENAGLITVQDRGIY